MKWRIEKKYLKIGFIALAVLVLATSFRYILEHETKLENFKTAARGTLWPIVMGIILAYLLNPILNFFEHYLFTPLAKQIFKGEKKEKKQMGFSRGFGILCTVFLFLVLVIGGLYLVIPQLYLSLGSIVTEAPNYYNSVAEWVTSLDKENLEISKYLLTGWEKVYVQAITYLNENVLPNMDKIVAGITSGIVVGVKAILNVILAIIISIYVMMEKEILISVAKKLTFSIFSRKNANAILKGMRYADQVFGGFISGKLIDSFIIGLLCYLFMLAAGFDYPVLISIIIGVTNIIPYFGPCIGAVPCVLILLMQDAWAGLIFAVFIVVLQQVDGNIIGPVILGDRLKISSMWILFAILIGGGFFGVLGMILGAPCFACLYALVGTVCESRLKEKRLPIHTEDYWDIDQAMLDGDGVILKPKMQPENIRKKREKQTCKKAEQGSQMDGQQESVTMDGKDKMTELQGTEIVDEGAAKAADDDLENECNIEKTAEACDGSDSEESGYL